MDIQKFCLIWPTKSLVLICCIKDCGTAESDFFKIVQQYKAYTFNKTFVYFGNFQEKLQIFYSDIFGYRAGLIKAVLNEQKMAN